MDVDARSQNNGNTGVLNLETVLKAKLFQAGVPTTGSHLPVRFDRTRRTVEQFNCLLVVWLHSNELLSSNSYPRKLSLALRTLPKASASESPAVTPTFLRISSLISQRKKGLVFFSAPMVDGTVGTLRDRLSLTSLNRATKSGLLGSTLTANLPLLWVYSWALQYQQCTWPFRYNWHSNN